MYLAHLKRIGSLDSSDTPWPPLSLASRTRRSPHIGTPRSIRTPGPIHRMPPEILSKVFVEFTTLTTDLNPTSVVDGITTSSTYIPMVLCHVSGRWRQIAFSIPQLWENLSTRLVLYGVSPQKCPGAAFSERFVVRKQTIEFLNWWAANIRNNKRFALRIQFIWREFSDLYQHPPGTRTSDIVVLGKSGLSTILNLVSRARYLNIDNHSKISTFLHFMAMRHSISELLLSNTIGFSDMESLVFQQSDDPENFDRLPFHRMSALRRLRLDQTYDRPPPGSNPDPGTIHPYLQSRMTTMWGRLTHLSIRVLKTTLAEWKTFMGTCVALESARINLMLVYSPLYVPIPGHPQGGTTKTLPNLRELCLDIFDEHEIHSNINLFQDLHFPALHSLILNHTWVLPRAVLHLLLQSTPSLERLHIGSMFPFALDDQRKPVPQWVDPSSTQVGRLNSHVPSLKQLTFAIPREYWSSVDRYMNGILHNGWLQGPWRTNDAGAAQALRVEFHWFPLVNYKEEEIGQIEEFLASEMELDALKEDVDVLVKGSVFPFELDIPDFEVPLWETWFNFDASFSRSGLGGEATLRNVLVGTAAARLSPFHSAPILTRV